MRHLSGMVNNVILQLLTNIVTQDHYGWNIIRVIDWGQWRSLSSPDMSVENTVNDVRKERVRISWMRERQLQLRLIYAMSLFSRKTDERKAQWEIPLRSKGQRNSSWTRAGIRTSGAPGADERQYGRQQVCWQLCFPPNLFVIFTHCEPSLPNLLGPIQWL